MPLDAKEVYRVRSEQDPTALIGLDAKVVDGYVTWFDTNRDRGHAIVRETEEGGAIVFETDRGLIYRFEPLTKMIYDAEVRRLVELSPEFESTEAMRKFYKESFLGDEAA